MTAGDPRQRFTEATRALVGALEAAAAELDGQTIADVDEAMTAYERARTDRLHDQGGPYPVRGKRGWVQLDDAPGVGDRTGAGGLRCQSRAADPDGIPHRCVLRAGHHNDWDDCDFRPDPALVRP